MAVDPSSSPIAPLLDRIERAAFNAAPERQEALRKMIEQHGIRIEFEHYDDSFCVNVDRSRKIKLGLAVLERLWAYAYAYVHLLIVVQEHEGGIDLDLTSDPRCRDAMRL